MKKNLLVFIFCFFLITLCKASCPVPDSACTVITLKNGQLIYCKLKKVSHSAIEYAPCGNPNGTIAKISPDSATMINFPDGKYVVMHGENNTRDKLDTVGVLVPHFYFSLLPGYSFPVTSYSNWHAEPQPNSQGNSPAGYAAAAVSYMADLEGTDENGNGGILHLGYFRNPFNVKDFLNDNLGNVTLDGLYRYYHVPFYQPNATENIQLNGTSYYSNYAFMFGLNKEFYSGRTYLSINFSVGAVILNTPALNETLNITYSDSANNRTTVNDVWQVSSYTTYVGVIDFGAALKIMITPHIYVALATNSIVGMQRTRATVQSKISDANGNTIVSPSLVLNTDFSVFNAAFGIGYCF